MWSSFVAIFRKEFLHVFRDRGTFALAFAIPLFQLILFGFIDQTVKNVATVVVDQDRSSDSRELIDRLRATRTFRIDRITGNASDARADIRAARARVGIVIPPDYHAKRTRGEDAKILVLIDGSDSSVSSQALASVNGLAAQVNLEEIERLAPAAKGPLSAQPVILFNPDGLMLGKLGPYLFIGVAEMGLILAAMRFGFSVPIRGSLVFLFAIAIFYLFALLAMGLFVSTRTSTQAEALQMAQMFLLPSIFLSGYIFPVEGLPLILRSIGRVLPATHMVAIMRGVVLRDAGPTDLWPHVLALIAISVVLVWMSVRSFRKVAV